MPLLIQPVTEDDLPQYYTVAYDALSENGPYALVFPNGCTAADSAHLIKWILQDWRAAPERNFLVKVIDTALPPSQQILGVSRWILYDTPGSMEAEAKEKAERAEREAKEGNPPYAPSMDVGFRKAMIAMGVEKRKEYMGGQAFLYLQLCVVRPSAQRRGVGGMILKWGTEKADGLGLPVYLESTMAGERAYAKYGFEKLGEKVYPRGNGDEWWANDERGSHYIMRRPAKTT